jgi:predicted nuclease of predicted toxin-antitoxin system
LNLRVILDENIPPQIADHLRAKRPAWDVRHVRDIGLRGASDQIIFEWAREHSAIVITFDEDFADTRMYPTGSHAGVIRLRVWPTTIEQIEEALDRLLNAVPDESLSRSLIIIDNLKIRIRRVAQHG